jgi:hypothetical protein
VKAMKSLPDFWGRILRGVLFTLLGVCAQGVVMAQSGAGNAGAVLSASDAARLLGGYWQIRFEDDGGLAHPAGVLQVTEVNPGVNMTAFQGTYSPDGLNTCPVTGRLIYSTLGKYAANGTEFNVELENWVSMRFSCSWREINIEALFVATTPVQFLGRATHVQGGVAQTANFTMRRFRASF